MRRKLNLCNVPVSGHSANAYHRHSALFIGAIATCQEVFPSIVVCVYLPFIKCNLFVKYLFFKTSPSIFNCQASKTYKLVCMVKETQYNFTGSPTTPIVIQNTVRACLVRKHMKTVRKWEEKVQESRSVGFRSNPTTALPELVQRFPSVWRDPPGSRRCSPRRISHDGAAGDPSSSQVPAVGEAPPTADSAHAAAAMSAAGRPYLHKRETLPYQFFIRPLCPAHTLVYLVLAGGARELHMDLSRLELRRDHSTLIYRGSLETNQHLYYTSEDGENMGVNV
jgi:hypothetical protein